MFRIKHNRIVWSKRRWKALRQPLIWPYVLLIVMAALVMIIARLLL
ncbi:MAG: hypothetical protein AAFX99_00805 [Myxococcota bacterium]